MADLFMVLVGAAVIAMVVAPRVWRARARRRMEELDPFKKALPRIIIPGNARHTFLGDTPTKKYKLGT
jgi:hypothetical protein